MFHSQTLAASYIPLCTLTVGTIICVKSQLVLEGGTTVCPTTSEMIINYETSYIMIFISHCTSLMQSNSNLFLNLYMKVDPYRILTSKKN